MGYLDPHGEGECGFDLGEVREDHLRAYPPAQRVRESESVCERERVCERVSECVCERVSVRE